MGHDPKIFTQLLACAREFAEHSHSPYSKFPVGAALLMEDGRIYGGCNIENASYSLTMCAEAVAIGKAVSSGNHRISHALVFAKNMDFCPPCGSCRQRLLEFSTPQTLVYLTSSSGQYQTHQLHDLIPSSFSLEQTD